MLLACSENLGTAPAEAEWAHDKALDWAQESSCWVISAGRHLAPHNKHSVWHGKGDAQQCSPDEQLHRPQRGVQVPPGILLAAPTSQLQGHQLQHASEGDGRSSRRADSSACSHSQAGTCLRKAGRRLSKMISAVGHSCHCCACLPYAAALPIRHASRGQTCCSHHRSTLHEKSNNMAGTAVQPHCNHAELPESSE